MKIKSLIPLGTAVGLILLIILLNFVRLQTQSDTLIPGKNDSYWFLLHRKSQTEELYKGKFGDKKNSKLVKSFKVKTGIAGERPTPLPQLLGRDYWKVASKEAQFDNPETAPYFMYLDVPGWETEPYGPTPYEECNGQCNWMVPGPFGLHGTASDSSRLSPENPGSSGCIRHSDEDITYLYDLLNPEKEEVRYYIEDN